MAGKKKEQGPTLLQGITHTQPNLLAVRTHLAQIFLAHSQSNPVSTEQAASTQEAADREPWDRTEVAPPTDNCKWSAIATTAQKG